MFHTVILLVVIGPIVRKLMLQAYDMGLINGEFAFFSFYPFNNRFIFGDDNWQQVCSASFIFNSGGGNVNIIEGLTEKNEMGLIDH